MIVRRGVILAVVCFFVAGCAIRGSSPTPGLVHTEVIQKGGGAQFVQFMPHTVTGLYSAIVAGPDGNMWFIDENARQLVRMSMTGNIKVFNISASLPGNPVSMTVGADKKFYISDESTSITRVTTSGNATMIPIPSGDNTAIDGLALGPDGNVWFAEFSHIAKVTPSGVVTEFPYPAGYGANNYGGVTAGSDGNVWFGGSSQNAIGRIVPSTGKITMFPLSGSCIPAPVVLAKDNNVWFVCLTSSPLLGRITPSGNITMYPIGGVFNFNQTEQFCSRGADGEPWCASNRDDTLIRVNTATQTVTTFNPPLSSGAHPDAVAAGPDGNTWMDTAGSVGDIDVLVANPMTVTPRTLTFTAVGQTNMLAVSENGVATWTATSSNPSVATVVQGGTNSTFKVTAAGVGTCRITNSDGVGNSVAVKVTVT